LIEPPGSGSVTAALTTKVGAVTTAPADFRPVEVRVAQAQATPLGATSRRLRLVTTPGAARA